MSARRQARAKVAVAMESTNGVPRCLALGRCTEVWCTADVQPDPHSVATIAQTRRRFNLARSHWLASVGIDDKDGWSVIPAGHAFSVLFMISAGRGRDATARLGAVGCTVDDLDQLAIDAGHLYAEAVRHDTTQSHRYLKEQTR